MVYFLFWENVMVLPLTELDFWNSDSILSGTTTKSFFFFFFFLSLFLFFYPLFAQILLVPEPVDSDKSPTLDGERWRPDPLHYYYFSFSSSFVRSC